ncbi:hypothetical protein GCM10022215_39090 [Nocardioides fonticola]|uniref:Uncharacterized protein n=1 Tax=Nocardioides fonticola TaxID=450363 RepID=A0ABP7XYL1_9ACTN
MFRRNRRAPGRHTEAYLSRRATRTARDAAVDATDGPSVPVAEAEVSVEPEMSVEADAAVDATVEAAVEQHTEHEAEHEAEHEESEHESGTVLCGRCETLLAGDELNAKRAQRAAGAA